MSTRRTSYNRRRTTLADPQVIANPILTLTSYSGNTVEFSWATPQERLVINGIPRIINTTSLEEPIALVSASDTAIVVEYPTAPASEDIFFIGERDPSIRTYWGGFISAGFFKSSAGPTPPTPLDWIAEVMDANNVLISLIGAPAEWGLVNNIARVAISNQSTAETSQLFTFAGASEFNVEFPFSGVTAGDTIQVTNGAAVVVAANGQTLENGTRVAS